MRKIIFNRKTRQNKTKQSKYKKIKNKLKNHTCDGILNKIFSVFYLLKSVTAILTISHIFNKF